MSSIRKLVAMLGVLFASSSLLVSCNDDDYPKDTMGAIVVNSLQTTSSSATAYWTVVSNGSCDGYKVVINEGTRANKGAEVVNQTFKPKEYTATFTGLKSNTTYVITTQAIPSQSSGRTKADTYELQFVTAPAISGLVFGPITYNEEGKGSTTVTWNQLDGNNCGGYTVDLQAWGLKDPTKEESKDNPLGWQGLKSETITNLSVVSVKFTNLIEPGQKCRVRVRPNPKNGCWYSAGDYTISDEVIAPAAQ